MDTLMKEALSFSKQLNKERAIIQEMKKRLNKDIIMAIETEDPLYIESGKFNIG
jgi:hypothetical protein